MKKRGNSNNQQRPKRTDIHPLTGVHWYAVMFHVEHVVGLFDQHNYNLYLRGEQKIKYMNVNRQ